jgi:FO synthase
LLLQSDASELILMGEYRYRSTSVQTNAPISFAEALAAAREGVISRETASILIRESGEEQLQMLLKVATEMRIQYFSTRVSFSKKVFIPLTNLCRDYCGYCTFRKDPGQRGAHTMTPDEVLAVAEAGARLNCKEALFSLGDRPEAIFPEMRDRLRRFGHQTTLSYLTEMCERVLLETGLLPHANPGLMGRSDQQRLKQFCPSLGLMLETSSSRLNQLGMAHENAPDKVPQLRLKTIAEAGKLGIPFTTGILIGIGETLDERVDSLFAIRELNECYDHIQEVIIQNFRSKPDIRMRHQPEPNLTDLARTIAVARLVLGRVNIQAPPNLSDENYPFLLQTGLNDWGGISPLTKDFINPEKPWPHIESLREKTESAGFQLKERLCIYPEVVRGNEFANENIGACVRSLADDEGYAKF